MTPLRRAPDFNDRPDVGHLCSSDGACRHQGARRAWLPYEPLLVAAGRPDQGELARQLGVARRTVCRWAHEGGLAVVQADRAACALGLHIGNIWPEWFGR